jgi:hypothetical protein
VESRENYGQKHGFKLLKQIRNQRVVSRALLSQMGTVCICLASLIKSSLKAEELRTEKDNLITRCLRPSSSGGKLLILQRCCMGPLGAMIEHVQRTWKVSGEFYCSM